MISRLASERVCLQQLLKQEERILLVNKLFSKLTVPAQHFEYMEEIA